MITKFRIIKKYIQHNNQIIETYLPECFIPGTKIYKMLVYLFKNWFSEWYACEKLTEQLNIYISWSDILGANNYNDASIRKNGLHYFSDEQCAKNYLNCFAIKYYEMVQQQNIFEKNKNKADEVVFECTDLETILKI